MKLPIIIFVLILLVSCNTFKYNNIACQYQTKGGFESYSSMRLYKDSTFTYEFQAGLLMGKTTGKWLLNVNKIILNSNKQPDKDSILVKESFVENQSSIEISVMNKYEEPLGAAVIILNNDSVNCFVCDDEGNLKIPEILKIDSLQIHYLGEIYNYKTKSDDYNKLDINVTFDAKYQSYRFFTNEIWQIRGGNLIDNMNYEYKKGKRTTHI